MATKRLLLPLVCAAVAACNAESPTALSDYNPALLAGKWAIEYSKATCSLDPIELNLAQFTNGGALPPEIRLFGSWQVLGEPATFSLEGTLARDTGRIEIELIAGVRTLSGIVLDNENLALGYTDNSGCAARAAARRIQ